MVRVSCCDVLLSLCAQRTFELCTVIRESCVQLHVSDFSDCAKALTLHVSEMLVW